MTVVEERIATIPRDQLTRGRFQNRDLFEEQKINELADSIRAVGILQPLIVRQLARPDQNMPLYEITDGERRWRAAERAGLDVVPCIVRDASDADTAIATVTANLQRADLTPIEEARGFKTLIDVGGLTYAEIAGKVGRAPDYIKESLGLLDLPEIVQKYAHAGAFTGPEDDPDRKLVKLSRSQAIALDKRHDPANERLTIALAERALIDGISAARLASDRDLHQVYYTLATEARDDQGNARADAPIATLPNGASFLKTHCFNCPFGAFRGTKEEYGGQKYCLRPAHLIELRERKRQEDEAATEAKIAEVKKKLAAAGQTVDDMLPKISELGYDNYKRIDREGKADACTQDCPCRGFALDYDGNPVAICIDPKRFVNLKMQDGRKRKKGFREEAKDRVKFFESEMDRAKEATVGFEQGFTERDLRLIAVTALGSITSQTGKLGGAGRQIIEYLGRPTLFPDNKGDGWYGGSGMLGKLRPGDLSGVPTPALIRFAVECLVRRDLLMFAENGTVGNAAALYAPPQEEIEQVSFPEQGAGEDAGATNGTIPFVDLVPAMLDATDAIGTEGDELPEIGDLPGDPGVVQVFGWRNWARNEIVANGLDPDSDVITLYRVPVVDDVIAFGIDADAIAANWGFDLENLPAAIPVRDLTLVRIGKRDVPRMVEAIHQEWSVAIVQEDPDTKAIRLAIVKAVDPDDPDDPETVGEESDDDTDLTLRAQAAVLDEMMAVAPAPAPTMQQPQRLPDRKLAESMRTLAGKMRGEIANKLRPVDPTVNMTRKRRDELAQRLKEGERLQRVRYALEGLADHWDAGTTPDFLSSIRNRVQIEDLLTYSDLPRDEEGRTRAGKMAIQTQERWTIVRDELIALVDANDGDREGRETRRKLEDLQARVRVQRPPGFFPTPKDLAERMVDLAQIGPNDVVVEPCAGDGALADAITQACPEATLICVEHNWDLAEILRFKGYAVGYQDYLTFDPGGPAIDRIVANFPFEDNQSLTMFRHAYNSLAPGGCIVAIVAPNALAPTERAYIREWQAWIGSITTIHFTPLESGTFAPHTSTGGLLIVADKPA